MKKIITLIFLFVYVPLFIAEGQPVPDGQQGSKWFKFVGGNFFNDRRIKQQIAMAGDLNLTESQLSEKLKNLLDIYFNEGYLAAKIDSVFWPENQSQNNPVTIYISEGKVFRLDQMFVFGNRKFSLNQIRRWMRIETGKIFQSRQLEEDIKLIMKQYADDGYLLVRVEIQKLDIDYDRNLVDIIINIYENRPVRLKDINVIGNNTTSRSVVLREIGINSNEIITQKNLDKIPERLRRLLFLELVNKPIIYFTEDSLAVIDLTVQERNNSQLNGVLGYNPKQGSRDGYFSGQLDLQFQNLLGTGRSFLAFWEKTGPISQSLRLNYKEPWLLGWPVNGEVGFYQNVQDTSFVRRSWFVGLQVHFLENISLGLRIGQENVIPDSIGRAIYGLPESRANRLYLEVISDSRNHIWNPTQGLMYQTSVDFVSKTIRPLFSGEATRKQDFRRMSLDLEFNRLLLKRQVVTIGLHGRQVKIGNQAVSIDELYRIGGANDLRGYRDDQFLGSRVAWGSLEYRLILEQESRIALFLDAGYIGRRDSNNNFQQLFRIGYGFGIRTNTELGIIGFDYGLGKGDSFSQGKIHLRLMNTF